jgi:tRNA-specific 2-thiouridylase
MRVAVAMSGGVDSSVTAALLKEEGYEVIGVTIQLWPSKELPPETEEFGGCCGLGAVVDAKRVAYKLGIPHYTINLRGIFTEKVIADFCREYSLGRTPNPCIRCNRHIKFDALLQRVKELDAEFVATGHYARIEYDEVGGRHLLKKGLDLRKDQSYVLYVMTQEQLRHTLLPLGNLTKERVRQIARERGLTVASKPESQEICFIPDGDYPKFLKEYIPEAVSPGSILDPQGNVLGEHRGILFYTIGQRKRLGIPAREPLYVLDIDRGRNAIVVGTRNEIRADELIASDINYVAISRLKQPMEVKAKIRYLHQEAEARVTPLGEDKVRVKFEEPQWAVTPGQAVVFYNQDTVIGGGTIEQAGNKQGGESYRKS